MQSVTPFQAMNYQSFLLGFVLIIGLLAVVLPPVDRVLERFGLILYPMVELLLILLIGITYSVVAIHLSTNWSYRDQLLVGIAVGVVVGGGLMLGVSLIYALISTITDTFNRRR